MTPQQQELIRFLTLRWAEHPDWTFGNLVAEYCYLAVGHTELPNVSDEKMIQSLRSDWK